MRPLAFQVFSFLVSYYEAEDAVIELWRSPSGAMVDLCGWAFGRTGLWTKQWRLLWKLSSGERATVNMRSQS